MYEKFIRPLLFQLDEEDAHNLAKWSMIHLPFLTKKPELCRNHGKNYILDHYSQPRVGLAAGFDKNGELLRVIHKFGVGFYELGSVTAVASTGNPRPRMQRVPQLQAAINKMGLNSDGIHQIERKIKEEGHHCKIPFGVNLAKANLPDADLYLNMQVCFEKLQEHRLPYVVLNISCPNTHKGLGKELGEIEKVLQLRKYLQTTNFLLKLSPDASISFTSEVVELSKNYDVSGFICGNTTSQRPDITAGLTLIPGGMSGSPLKKLNLKLTELVNSIKSKDQFIIGCGGIMDGRDAYDYWQAGARLFQIYTALIYRGPYAAVYIQNEFEQIMRTKNAGNS